MAFDPTGDAWGPRDEPGLNVGKTRSWPPSLARCAAGVQCAAVRVSNERSACIARPTEPLYDEARRPDRE
jgi:hypothetical protein